MNLGKPYHVGVLASRQFEHPLGMVVPVHERGWLACSPDGTKVILLDPKLNELLRLDLPPHPEPTCATSVALSPDGRLLASSGRTGLLVVDPGGAVVRRVSHHPWEPYCGSGCFFDHAGSLWFVQPGDRRGVDDRLTVIEPETGATVAERAIENEVGFFDFHRCPAGDGVLIELGCGQDGVFLIRARLDGSGLAVTRYPFSDRTFSGGFSPDGTEFVTGAQEGDAVKVHSSPTGHVVATLTGESVFADDDLSGETPDTIGYQAVFLDNDHLLAGTTFGRLILIRRRGMRLLGTVWAEGQRVRGYDERGKETDDPGKVIDFETGLVQFHPAGRGKVLGVFDDGTIRLLDLSPLLSEG